MDIDCDGIQGGPGDDGRCGHSTDTQSTTSFSDVVQSYADGVADLNANVHPYVVFGNTGNKPGYVNFDPQKYGVRPLSVMAVVCNNTLVCTPFSAVSEEGFGLAHIVTLRWQIYGIWGDENGDDENLPLVGEASISLATACFGDSMNGDNGHGENDVLYIAFIGKDAVPGASANWSATSYDDFERSIQGLGDKLIKRIGASAAGNYITYNLISPRLDAKPISRLSARTGSCCAPAAGSGFGCIIVAGLALHVSLSSDASIRSIAKQASGSVSMLETGSIKDAAGRRDKIVEEECICFEIGGPRANPFALSEHCRYSKTV
jgi:hypothetical protein